MWAQVINAILGIWLMAAPEVLGLGNKAADNDHIIGPVIATFAITSCWECTRVVRLYNIPLGCWLLIAPWILGYDDTFAIVNDMMVGIVVVLLSFFKGKIEKHYGGGWASLWKKDSLHERAAIE